LVFRPTVCKPESRKKGLPKTYTLDLGGKELNSHGGIYKI